MSAKIYLFPFRIVWLVFSRETVAPTLAHTGPWSSAVASYENIGRREGWRIRFYSILFDLIPSNPRRS